MKIIRIIMIVFLAMTILLFSARAISGLVCFLSDPSWSTFGEFVEGELIVIFLTFLASIFWMTPLFLTYIVDLLAGYLASNTNDF